MDLPLILSSSMLLTLSILSTPILLPILFKNYQNSPTTIGYTIKTSFITSLIPMALFM